jgi:hypothetical protein
VRSRHVVAVKEKRSSGSRGMRNFTVWERKGEESGIERKGKWDLGV